MCIVGPRNVSQHSSLLHNDTSPSSAKPMIKSQFDAVTIDIVFCPAHLLFKIFIFSNLFKKNFFKLFSDRFLIYLKKKNLF